MIIPKQYLHDRRVLLIGSVNAFLMVVVVLSVLLRIDTSHSSFIVQYRSNVPIDAFKSGTSRDLYAFAVFAVFAAIFHTLLSFRVYLIHRQLAMIVLLLGTLLLVLTAIVSNALLVLR